MSWVAYRPDDPTVGELFPAWREAMRHANMEAVNDRLVACQQEWQRRVSRLAAEIDLLWPNQMLRRKRYTELAAMSAEAAEDDGYRRITGFVETR